MKIVIMGASSGLGAKLASLYIAQGHEVACAARRQPSTFTPSLFTPIDVNSPDASAQLQSLIDRLGGMDLYIHVAGIGYDNPDLLPERDVEITQTNCTGFVRMVSTAFRWFANHNPHGQIAAISSVAGTRGTSPMEAYCASKRFDWTYLEGLRQRAATAGLKIAVTDIRPGWTRTPLLKPDKNYPLLMQPERVCHLIIKAIAHRRKTAYIDLRWQLLCMLWQLIPSAVWRHINATKFGFA